MPSKQRVFFVHVLSCSSNAPALLQVSPAVVLRCQATKLPMFCMRHSRASMIKMQCRFYQRCLGHGGACVMACASRCMRKRRQGEAQRRRRYRHALLEGMLAALSSISSLISRALRTTFRSEPQISPKVARGHRGVALLLPGRRTLLCPTPRRSTARAARRFGCKAAAHGTWVLSNAMREMPLLPPKAHLRACGRH